LCFEIPIIDFGFAISDLDYSTPLKTIRNPQSQIRNRYSKAMSQSAAALLVVRQFQGLIATP